MCSDSEEDHYTLPPGLCTTPQVTGVCNSPQSADEVCNYIILCAFLLISISLSITPYSQKLIMSAHVLSIGQLAA